ncbi:MAG: M28 family peptidase [Sphingomonadales bacterium]
MVFSFPAIAEEDIDLEVINQIRDEGFTHSEVVDILRHLTDEIGPRLTGSPQMKAANDWTLSKLQEWGLENGYLDAYEFGRGWTMEKSLVTMITPRHDQLYAFPLAWTIGTDGPIEAEVVLAEISSKDDFEKFKGKLEGKIVLVTKPSYWNEPSNEVFHRGDEKDLTDLAKFPVPEEELERPEPGFLERVGFYKELADFLAAEGAVAAIKKPWREGHLIQAQAYFHMVGSTMPIPMLEMASEHYNRMARLVEAERDVVLRLDLETTFYDEDPNAYNTIAEIPGQGRNPEIVMVGAHLDSWAMADGAVDNGAGSAVVMEAMRILASLPNFKPKRTIRIGLWSGEEQGFYGSLTYIRKHFAERPFPEEIKYEGFAKETQTFDQWPITTKPDYERFAGYFNVDNGSGKIRGIYTQGNVATAEIFEEWFKPFHDLGAETVVTNYTRGTDHVPFQNVGLPAYQFIQDPLDYGSRLHHTQLDTFDHIVPEDLKQASVILASFLYLAATRDDPLPRKPLPRQTDEDKKWKAQEAEEKAEKEAKEAKEAEEQAEKEATETEEAADKEG